MKRQKTIITLASVFLVIAITILYFFLFQPKFRNEGEHELKKSFSILSEAANINELELAVGDKGHVFKYPDGWIAIRYRDNHQPHQSYSHAIALDSKGHWYKSDYHFCGGLSNIEKARAAAAFYSEHLPNEVPKEIMNCLTNDSEGKQIDDLISIKKTEDAIVIMKNIWNFKDIEVPKQN